MLKLKDLLSNKPIFIAGPCSISSRNQIIRIAKEVKKAGADVVRCALWKPRTEPTSFQGVGSEGIQWVIELKRRLKIPVAMEVMCSEHVDLLKNIADILWIGARNIQNYELIKRVSKEKHPVILKRGFISTIREWYGAAQYLGLNRVIACERGIRTGADSMRFTLDLNAMLAMKHDKHLAVLVDPSHPAGRRDMVEHLSYAGIAAGADGLIIEVHYSPEEELVDHDQTIDIATFQRIVNKSRKIYDIIKSS